MFFLFSFIIAITFITLAVLTSKIEIDVENLEYDTITKKKIVKIYVYLLIFNKIKILRTDINKIKLKIKKEKLAIKLFQKNKLDINIANSIDLKIKKIDLLIEIGTEDSALTAILVGVLSSILGITIKMPKYVVKPVYNNNIFKIKLNGIFTANLMQYIYSQIKKRRVDNYGRTSNRKSYANCNG